MNILFVCRGIVGRSQIAEALFKKETGEKYNIFSVGTKLSGPEEPIGELVPGTAAVIEVMNEIGIDVSKNIRKQITEDMVASADMVILVVDEHDPLPEYVVNNTKITTWNVPDPKGQSLEFTRSVRDEIHEHVKELATNLAFLKK